MSNQNLSIPLADWKNMQQHVAALAPEEACGLLAGKDCRVSQHFAIENELHSYNRFRMEAQAQLNAFLRMEKLNIDLLAYYHSHPTGKGEPSATDLAEFLYPDVFMLIWYQQDDIWQAKAWSIEEKSYSPVIIEIIES